MRLPSSRNGRGRIALVSEDLDLPVDEGLKKFVYSVGPELANMVELTTIATGGVGLVGATVEHHRANRMMFGRKLRRRLTDLAPDAVVYVPRAAGTRNSFLRMAVLGAHAGNARRVLVSLQPRQHDRIARLVIRRLAPDVAAGQGAEVRDQLRSLGLRTVAIPSGVNLAAFSIPARDEVPVLRRKYGLDEDKPVVLHVGHMRRSRNVQLLARLAESTEAVVVMVASTSTSHDDGLSDELRRSGVVVIDTFLESIAELYRLANCYLFPVHISYGAIEMPLSVLEAMACGVPVVSTRFGSLRDWLPPGAGIAYGASDEDLIVTVKNVLLAGSNYDPSTIRQRVEGFGWGQIAEQLLRACGMGARIAQRADYLLPQICPRDGAPSGIQQTEKDPVAASPPLV